MSTKKTKEKHRFASYLKGKELEDFKKQLRQKETLFPEKVKRANEIIKKTKFLDD